MRLRVFAPTHVEVDEQVRRVAVQGEAGAFTMLPRHVDMVAVLEPGLLAFDPEAGQEVFVAVDGGAVVKVGDDVLVSTPNAVRGTDLDAMRRTLEETFLERDERDIAAGLALNRLEVDMVQRMVELEQGGVAMTREDRTRFFQTVEIKARRKRDARERRESVWFGFGMFGLVGWSVALPTLLGIAVGIWLDARASDPEISWTLTGLAVGVVIGCAVAWHWIRQEAERSIRHKNDTEEQDADETT